MQHPTCTNTRIRSTQDAHKIFYAIQQGLLHMVTRRLDSDEREALRSGCIYVWEERGPQSEITGLGIERFTEGRRWSPSRVRDEFLFYYEKTPAKDVAHPGDRHPLGDWHQLVKQTYSVWVETEKGRRKWHLTAYFTQEDIDQLGTVDDIPDVRELVVPDGHFKSTRVGKSRTKADDSNARAGESSKPSTVTRTYAPFPSPYPPYQSQSESAASSQPVMMYEPYQNMHNSPSYSDDQVPRSSRFSSSPTASLRTPYVPDSGSYQRSGSYDSSQGSPSDLSRAPLNGVVHLQQPYQLSSSYGTPPTGHEHSGNRSSPTYHHPGTTPGSSMQNWRASSAQDVSDRQYAGSHALPPNYSQSSHPASITTGNIPSYAGDPHMPPIQTSNPLLYRTLSPVSHMPGPSSQILPPAYVGTPNSARRPLSPLQIPEANYPVSYELSPADSGISDTRVESVGPCRGLVPLAAIIRPHPYRREPQDDKALRLLLPHKP